MVKKESNRLPSIPPRPATGMQPNPPRPRAAQLTNAHGQRIREPRIPVELPSLQQREAPRRRHVHSQIDLTLPRRRNEHSQIDLTLPDRRNVHSQIDLTLPDISEHTPHARLLRCQQASRISFAGSATSLSTSPPTEGDARSSHAVPNLTIHGQRIYTPFPPSPAAEQPQEERGSAMSSEALSVDGSEDSDDSYIKQHPGRPSISWYVGDSPHRSPKGVKVITPSQRVTLPDDGPSPITPVMLPYYLADMTPSRGYSSVSSARSYSSDDFEELSERSEISNLASKEPTPVPPLQAAATPENRFSPRFKVFSPSELVELERATSPKSPSLPKLALADVTSRKVFSPNELVELERATSPKSSSLPKLVQADVTSRKVFSPSELVELERATSPKSPSLPKLVQADITSRKVFSPSELVELERATSPKSSSLPKLALADVTSRKVFSPSKLVELERATSPKSSSLPKLALADVTSRKVFSPSELVELERATSPKSPSLPNLVQADVTSRNSSPLSYTVRSPSELDEHFRNSPDESLPKILQPKRADSKLNYTVHSPSELNEHIRNSPDGSLPKISQPKRAESKRSSPPTHIPRPPSTRPVVPRLNLSRLNSSIPKLPSLKKVKKQ